METIILEVSPQIAQRFKALTSKEKNLISAFFESWLMNLNENKNKKNHDLAIKEFLETVENIGLNATKRGMTDEILESILNED